MSVERGKANEQGRFPPNHLPERNSLRVEHVEAAVEDALVSGDAVRADHVGLRREERRGHEAPHARVEVDAGSVDGIVDLELEVQLQAEGSQQRR